MIKAGYDPELGSPPVVVGLFGVFEIPKHTVYFFSCKIVSFNFSFSHVQILDPVLGAETPLFAEYVAPGILVM